MKIDINADLGESFGQYTLGDDEKLMGVITSANVACGYHAGDYRTIPQAIKLAKEANVAIGAHPGYPDLLGFGRRNMDIPAEEVYQLVVYQIGAVKAFCMVEGIQLHHVKPHGALYNEAAKNRNLALAIVQAVKDVDPQLVLYGLANSQLIEAAKKLDLAYASEVFADRTYTEEGLLTSRQYDGAVLTSLESIKKQVSELIFEGVVTTATNKKIPMQADTLCFHGDGQSAYHHAKAIRDMLEANRVNVQAINY
ncbi:LamB/YcsF family protein [Alkalibacillus haloalkaliphilus]|uniref:LamB/YcsF family protein n=1 Tax=Alkalibacillus haloalkaliphilus TaxID=94136 RepID=UPI0002E6E19A|nr:5-oxoprolinase subunit PxpA [Alkalibacillus haloalkaliphilus]